MRDKERVRVCARDRERKRARFGVEGMRNPRMNEDSGTWEFEVWGLRFEVLRLWMGIWGLGFRVWG